MGRDHVLPEVELSGRWENLPICALEKPRPATADGDGEGGRGGRKEAAASDDEEEEEEEEPPGKKPYRLVACTWTSSQHQRRGNERRISDGKLRLREWIAFNLEAGFDHIYVYDNSGANSSIFRLKDEIDTADPRNDDVLTGNQDRIQDGVSSVTDLFPASQVTRIDWPATVCNNNRPAHDDPGERSSQYAAEASCLTRYGAHTDWMASMDPDEYFVPMGKYTSWKEILDKIDREEGLKILKFRSTRARPLLELLT